MYFASFIYVFLFLGILYIVYNCTTVHYCLHDMFTHTGCVCEHTQHHIYKITSVQTILQGQILLRLSPNSPRSSACWVDSWTS